MSDSKKQATPTKGAKKQDDKNKNAKDGGKQEKDSAAAKATKTVDLGFLEADDDFEEFPTEPWKCDDDTMNNDTKVTTTKKAPGAKAAAASAVGVGGTTVGTTGSPVVAPITPEDDVDIERVNIWEDDWDDDNIEEDFSILLKAEFEKRMVSTAAIRH